jgi:hypothetical protein
MTLHKITEFYTELFSVYHNITSNFAPSPYLKTASNKIMIQIKLIGMSMISYYTKVHLSKSSGSWVVSTKQTMNFNIQTAAMFVFFVLDKNGLVKSYSSFEDLSVYKIHCPTLTGAVLYPLQKFERPLFCNGWRYGIKIMASRSPSMAWPPY